MHDRRAAGQIEAEVSRQQIGLSRQGSVFLRRNLAEGHKLCGARFGLVAGVSSLQLEAKPCVSAD